MRTKIIATIGPSSESPDMIRGLVGAGMDIARINFSHSSHDGFLRQKTLLAAAAKKSKRPVLVMQDLQGPRIRVGELPKQGITLRDNDTIVFSVKKNDGETIFIDNARLPGDIGVGDTIYLANGDMELVTTRVAAPRIFAKVIRGGILYSRKSVNLPHTKLSDSGLTAKDVRDAKFALKHGVDMIAVSFVQSSDDINALRRIVGDKVKIVAKIETAVAVKNIDAIIRASDAVMIARGDLGIEVPIEKVPFIQKNIIRHASWYGKGTITATQMLTSMVSHPHPTRAEVSDIANAVWDGTDAVMLSDETASGKYPIEALKMMVRVVGQAEKSHFERPNPFLA